MKILAIYLADFWKQRKVVKPGNSKEFISHIKKVNFVILVTALAAGMVYTSWKFDNALSREFSPANLLLSAEDSHHSNLRTLIFETRSKTSDGALDETNTYITGYKVEVLSFTAQLPSFYRLRSQIKAVKDYQNRIFRLPNTPLALNQILRI
jgi:hypothetical protein